MAASIACRHPATRIFLTISTKTNTETFLYSQEKRIFYLILSGGSLNFENLELEKFRHYSVEAFNQSDKNWSCEHVIMYPYHQLYRRRSQIAIVHSYCLWFTATDQVPSKLPFRMDRKLRYTVRRSSTNPISTLPPAWPSSRPRCWPWLPFQVSGCHLVFSYIPRSSSSVLVGQ